MTPGSHVPLVLCAGSTVRHGFVDTISAAVDAGFDGVTVWKRTCRRALERESIDLVQMRSLLDDRNLFVTEVEGIAAWVPGWSASSADDPTFEEGLEYAETLRARNVLLYAGPSATDESQLVGPFALACDRAEERGLEVVLEFLPWSAVPDLATALRIVMAAGRPNGRVVFDTWHHARSGANWPTAFDPSVIGCIQISDGPAQPLGDDLLHETMFLRELPGQGGFGVRESLVRLGEHGFPCPVGVEVYNDTLAGLSTVDLANTLAWAVRDVLPDSTGEVTG